MQSSVKAPHARDRLHFLRLGGSLSKGLRSTEYICSPATSLVCYSSAIEPTLYKSKTVRCSNQVFIHPIIQSSQPVSRFIWSFYLHDVVPPFLYSCARSASGQQFLVFGLWRWFLDWHIHHQCERHYLLHRHHSQPWGLPAGKVQSLI